MFFKGRNIVTESVVTDKEIIVPVIEIEGAADIAEGVTLGGGGILSLESGGYLSIKGPSQSGRANRFRRRYGPSFDRQSHNISWNTWVYPSGRCPNGFPGDPSSIRGRTSFVHEVEYSRFMRDQIRRAISLLRFMFRPLMGAACLPSHLSLTRNEFALSSDGKGGTRVTYLPGGTTNLEQSMPVPLIARKVARCRCKPFFPSRSVLRLPGSIASRYCLLTPQTNTKTDYRYWFNKAPSSQWPRLSFTPAWFVCDNRIPPYATRYLRTSSILSNPKTMTKLNCWSGITSIIRLNLKPESRELALVESQKSSPIAYGLLILP